MVFTPGTRTGKHMVFTPGSRSGMHMALPPGGMCKMHKLCHLVKVKVTHCIATGLRSGMQIVFSNGKGKGHGCTFAHGIAP